MKHIRNRTFIGVRACFISLCLTPPHPLRFNERKRFKWGVEEAEKKRGEKGKDWRWILFFPFCAREHARTRTHGEGGDGSLGKRLFRSFQNLVAVSSLATSPEIKPRQN